MNVANSWNKTKSSIAKVWNTVLSWITWGFTLTVTLGLLALFAGAVLAEFKFAIPYVPVVSFEKLAWASGAWFLFQGKKLW